jgi:hypothetical protein
MVAAQAGIEFVEPVDTSMAVEFGGEFLIIGNNIIDVADVPL